MTVSAREDGSNVPHEKLSQEFIAEEPGYLYIYLSNEDEVGSGEAFFDDFSITTSESYIVQTIDYYPYGLVASNWTREGEKATKDLFQGKTYEELTEWSDFHARQYDAAVGRWFGVDPAGQLHSPFVGMGNNPVMYMDPDGEWVHIAIGAVVGAVVGGVQAGVRGENVWQGIGVGAGIGALAAFTGGAASAAVTGGTVMSGGATMASGVAATSSLGSVMAGGAAAGFVSGSANSWMNGASFSEGLRVGFKGAGLGAVTSGALYGLSQGAGALSDRYFKETMKSAYAYEYTVDQVTGQVTRVSDLGGANTHFYHIGRYIDDGTAFLSSGMHMVTGANTINSFRFWQSAQSTISVFNVPSASLSGFFLEPAGPSTTTPNLDRRVPAGSYNLTPNMNSYPGDYMIYNNSVPASRGITIHSGNYPENTLGCLLPGCSWEPNAVLSSRSKLTSLRSYINRTGYRNARLNIYDVFR